ncbi:S8 family serine peptidase [Thiocapsa bogorovii]|uniref:S8 family serine peptidase n=1 Tax=Thiocapsa bogorovii TaxID=521689 RepID=UPI001E3F5882|nr:S8 family serine peptidase [Thiocapsa bogorovii]UHD15074.1 S8 family serine peptidase [Thiocapsa bogorovii]
MGTGEEENTLTSAHAESWAEAIASDNVRQALARNLDEIAEVPSGLPTSDLTELKDFLLHFGTYKSDGTYYTKGTVTEGEFPAGVGEPYLAADTGNVAEVRLPRDQFYCSALVPERLWSPQAPADNYRQLVYRIEDQGEDATERWRLGLVHTVSAYQPSSGGFSRFVFFHAAVGLGLAVPEGARTALAPSTAGLLDELPAHLAALSEALSDSDTPIVGTTETPYVLLIGAVAEGFPRSDLPALPEGLVADGTGFVRTFRCPPEHVMALAQRDDVDDLELSTPVWPTMSDAMNELNLGARTFPSGVTAANSGHGVVVGIVDTGIDGGHPAFLGRHDDATKTRIHSVWHLWESGGESPWLRSGRDAAYRSMHFGREYIGHDEVTTTRDYAPDGSGGWNSGHGTHVAGIAAGRSFGAWPGGIAPGATIVVAGVGSRGGYVNDVIAGVKYCFQKATELGMPCVVNISLSTQRHSHDGTDPLSIGVTQLVSRNFVPATGLGPLPSAMPGYLDGRVICAAAGNLRSDPTHWQATIPAGSEASVLYQPFGRGGSSRQPNDGVSFWAYNGDGTTVRLRISARHSSNAVLATPEIGMRRTGGAITTNLPGGLRVNLHNPPERPNNRHFNPEVYWIRPTPATAVATAPWIIRLRNRGRAACIVHGFSAFREHRGGFVFDAARTQPLIGVTYTADQLASFESHKIGIPGSGHGTICVGAFTSRPGMAGSPVGEIAPFSSPGPHRAAAPGQRVIDVAAPGHVISSAKSWMPDDASRGVTDKSGTSMASPMVTGLVAALMQIDRNLDMGQIRNRLELASSRRATDSVDDWGLGRIDAAVLLRS